MPLILMCGFPCSGKSTRAQQLKEHFEKSCKKIVIIDDLSFASEFDRNQVFSDSQQEKQLRSFLKSEIQKNISQDAIVISDSANYIKGYRYELYCVSKSLKTTHCVVHCDLSREDCSDFNQLRPSASQYNANTFDALVLRFEAPDAKNRWDSPLFVIHKDEALPFEEVNERLFMHKPPPPNLSTQTKPLASANFLYELDKITQDVVKVILDAQKIMGCGVIHIPMTKDTVEFQTPVSCAELSRMRRQFITYTKLHSTIDPGRIASMFVQYINNRTSCSD